MRDKERAKTIFESYGGMMRTYQLSQEKIFYADIAFFIKEGLIEKIRTGCYQWVDSDNFSEALTVTRLFPDGVLCMDTALRYYNYSNRTPGQWHIAVSKYSNRTRFKLDYPFVKPYFVAPALLELGLCEQKFDGNTVKMYDKERVICDCLRYRGKIDRELFNKALRGYINDSGKNIPRLMKYAESLRCSALVKNLIGVWL